MNKVVVVYLIVKSQVPHTIRCM